MAHISGLVDVPDSPPSLRVMPRGTVLLNMDDLGLRFRNIAELASWLEHIDRQVVQLGPSSADALAAHHEKFQALRAVKGSAG